MQPKVAVAAVTFDRHEELGLLLKGLAEQTAPIHSIALVDSGTVPATDVVGVLRGFGYTITGTVTTTGRATSAVQCRDGFAADAEWIAYLLGRLEPYRGGHVTGGNGVVYLGPVDLALGRGAATLGERDRAVELLGSAVEQADRAGALGFAAEARYHLAVGLLARAARGDRERAEVAGRDADRLVRALATRLRVIYESALGEVELWNKSAAAQLDAQLRERRRNFGRRLEAIERIQQAANEPAPRRRLRLR